MGSRKHAWVRLPPSGSDPGLEWRPCAVSAHEEGKDAQEGKVRVFVQAWTSLLKRGASKSSAGSSSRSESDSEGEEVEEMDGEETFVERANVVERNEWERPPDDLVQLVHLHEPAILRALCERFLNSTIYTFCGPILLALNPFERLPLYSSRILQSYKKEDTEVAPHVYAVASAAFNQMVDESGREGSDRDQSILISGESGAGKTESTKIVMQFLATVARKQSEDGEELGELHVSEYLGEGGFVKSETGHFSIEQQVLESNPILESFGNAKTIRNDNSSRFGKFIQMQFNSSGFLVGASIVTYLLEKVRVSKQSEHERGYHVFYQMLLGGSDEEKKRWKIDVDSGPSDFEVISSGCQERSDGVSDASQFHVTKRAMRIMGFSDPEIDDTFKVVAIVMHLGNLQFSEHGEGTSRIDDERDEGRRSLESLLELLKIDRDSFSNSLCTRTVTAAGETFTKPLSAADAAATADALAKSIFSKNFEWIVARINESITHKKKARRFIGVLDIFGFEIFDHNSFEQLCINYCNERLQQQFNDFVFKQEQYLYEKEKISWKFIDFPSNSATVELIDGSGGILTTLDDECRLPKGSDAGFARKLYQNLAEKDRFKASKPQAANGEFVVVHYAGEVCYSTDGFLEKNQDALRQEALDLMQQSGNLFVKALFIEAAAKAKATSWKSTKGNERRSALSLTSVSAQFKTQLGSLVETIGTTAPHYIRCLKPNDVAKAKQIRLGRVVQQLQCGGVLEAVRVARAGFPVRMPHQIFIKRYGLLCGPHAIGCFAEIQPSSELLSRGRNFFDSLHAVHDADRSKKKMMSKELVDVLGQTTEALALTDLVQVGKTKVFMRKEGHDLLERWWSRWRTAAARIVFGVMLTNWRQTEFARTRQSAVDAQRMVRGFLARQFVHRMRCEIASLRIQTWMRMLHDSRKFKERRLLAVTIQSFTRGFLARKQVSELRKVRARLILQSWARSYRLRRDFVSKRCATIILQSVFRRFLAKAIVRKKRRAQRDLGNVTSDRDTLRQKVKALERELQEVKRERDDLRMRIASFEAGVSQQNGMLQVHQRDIVVVDRDDDDEEEPLESEGDWYLETFAQELQEIDQLRETAGVQEKKVQFEVHEEISSDLAAVEKELQEKRKSLELKRAELEGQSQDLIEEQPREEVANDGLKALERALQDLHDDKAKLKDKCSSLENEVDAKKAYIGELVGAKNQAEIKQGELELAANAIREEKAKLVQDLEKVKLSRRELENRIEKLEKDRQSEQDLAKSSAVLRLETDIRNANDELDELRKVTAKREKEIATMKSDSKVQRFAFDEYKLSAEQKITEMEKQLEELCLSSARSLRMSKAEAMFDRSSRKALSHAFQLWQEKVRLAKVRRRFLSRVIRTERSSEIRFALSVWRSFAAKEAQRDDEETRKTLISDMLRRRGDRLFVARLFRSWQQRALVRVEERHLYDGLRKVFEASKLRRHFNAWRSQAEKTRRLDILEEICISRKERQMLRRALWNLQRATSKKMTATSMEVPSPTKSKEDLDLIAMLMKRADEQDDRIEALNAQLQKRAENANGVANGAIDDSMEPSGIESEDSDDEDKNDDESVDDSFHIAVTPIANVMGSHRKQKERHSFRGIAGISQVREAVDPFRSHRLIRVRRNSSLGTPFEPGKEDLLTPGDANAEFDENEAHFKSSTAENDEGKQVASIKLGDIGLSHVEKDGTLAFDQELDAANPDPETLRQTAASLSMPPLVLAAQHGFVGIVEQFLDEGADPNIEDQFKHRTALHAAISAYQWNGDGSERMAELLLEHNAHVHARNAHSNTPLMEAVLKGDEAIALTTTLILHGAMKDIEDEGGNEFGQTPLHAASRVGAVKTAQLLLDNGASLIRADRQGQTAIHHAARLCNVEMLKMLLAYLSLANPKQNRDPRVIADNNGNTALHLVCSSSSPAEIAKAIWILLENDFFPNQKNNAGQTCLHVLSSNKYATQKVLKRFDRPGVRLHEQDRLGNTALHLALHIGNREIALGLVQMGSPLFIPNNESATPLDSVPQGLAIKLLRNIRCPPDESLFKRFHSDVKQCMIRGEKFRYFRDQHHCRHCGRICCSKCTSKKHPIVKFGSDAAITVCDHCFEVLSGHVERDSGAESSSSLEVD